MNKLCLAVGLSVCLGLSACGDDPNDLFMKCRVAETSGEVPQEKLIEMYREAVDAGSVDAALYMAYYELGNNNIVSARNYAEKFRTSRPNDFNIINGIFLINDTKNQENMDRGAELLKEAIAKNKTNSNAYYPLGEYYFKKKDYEKAVQNYEMAVQNRDFRARIPLARIYLDNLVHRDELESVFRLVYQEQHDRPSRESDMLLAKCYMEGLGTVIDLDKAGMLIKKYSSRTNDLEAQFLELKVMVMNKNPEVSAKGIAGMKEFLRKTNYPDAAYELYEIYFNGLYGQNRDVKEAVHYVRMAQSAGSNRALVALSRIYLEGIGVNKDENEAFSFARRAIEVSPNDVEAAYLIGVMYADGVGTKKDSEKGFEYINQAAEAGNRDALFRKAMMIQDGRGASLNGNEALVIFENLAKSDYAPAAFQYGELLFYGMGVERNVNESILYLKKAVNGGVAEALFPLASAYDEVGDAESALAWYRMVASSEDINAAEAAARAADIYFELHNYPEAEKFFKMAADHGHTVGAENLGRMYYIQGKYDEARETFMKMAKQSSYAQTFLGIMYERGQGVQKNDVYASEWYEKAIARGSIDARYLEAALIFSSKTLPDEMRSEIEPLLTKSACQGHAESIMFLGLKYYASVGNSDEGFAWLMYGARDHGINEASLALSKVKTSRDYLESKYSSVKSMCSQTPLTGN